MRLSCKFGIVIIKLRDCYTIIGFAIKPDRQAISKFTNQLGYGRVLRVSNSDTTAHRRNENTWREGKRQNTPRPPTRGRASASSPLGRNAHIRVPRFLWSDQWLEWLALDVEPKIPLGLPTVHLASTPFSSFFLHRSDRRSSSSSDLLELPSPREVRA